VTPRRFEISAVFVALGAAALLGIGCASGPLGSPSARDTEIERLERRVSELEREATVGRVETTRLRREIERLERELAAREAELEARAAPGGEVVEELPSGPILEEGPAIEETALEVEEIRAETPPPESEAEIPDTPTSTEGVVVAEPLPRSPADGAQGLYDEGYTLFHQKRYDEAETTFLAFLERHPGSALADNALFWVGESRYARGQLRQALEAFTATVERFPDGNKVPDAMVKAGKCFEGLGETAAARETYQEVRRRFPGTAASAIAAEHLEALR
jgi:tol-pal system protein YbgF